ncbi:hypothetical protein [Desulfoplanes sp.]
MHTNYIIRESQFSLNATSPQRKIGVNPKAVRLDIVLAQGGPIRVGLTDGVDDSRLSEIHTLHTVHSFDTCGMAGRRLVVSTTGSLPAHGTILVWGHGKDPDADPS